MAKTLQRCGFAVEVGFMEVTPASFIENERGTSDAERATFHTCKKPCLLSFRIAGLLYRYGDIFAQVEFEMTCE